MGILRRNAIIYFHKHSEAESSYEEQVPASRVHGVITRISQSEKYLQ
jgi:hypothetical protein